MKAGTSAKKSQLEEFTANVHKLRERHERIERDLQKKSEELETVNLKKLSEEARTIEQRKTSVEIRIAQLEFEKKRAQDNIDRNETESESWRKKSNYST